MRVRINIEANINERTIAAFEHLVGEATEKALADYILSQGYQGLELLCDEYDDMEEAVPA